MFVRLKLLTVLTVLLMAGGPVLSASAPPAAELQVERLEGLVQGFYLASVQGSHQLAYAYAVKIGETSAAPELRALGTPEGWLRFDETLGSAQRALSRGTEAAAWREAASRLLLAADALIPGREPMWLNYGRLVADDLDRIRRGWYRGGTEGAAASAVSLRLLKERMERLEAAASLGKPHPQISTLLERIRYAEKLLAAAERGEAKPQWIEESFAAIERDAAGLFGPAAVRASVQADGSRAPVWTALLAVIVLSVLGYTGWRKFQQDRLGITVIKRPL